MKVNQEHSSKGDNVAGNKYEEHSYFSTTDIHTNYASKLKSIKESENLDFEDSNVLKAMKEVIRELIEEEQQKSHQIVPIGTIRERFKSLFDEDTFRLLIGELLKENSIEIEDAQICCIPKKLNYKIQF